MRWRAWFIAGGCLLGGSGAVQAQTQAQAEVKPPAVVQEPGQGTQEFERTPPYEAQASRERRVLRMSAREAVDLALQNNLDLAIERFSRELALRRVEAARGYYDPNVSVVSSLSSAANPLTGVSGGTSVPSDHVDVLGFTPAVRQSIAGGGSVSLSLANTRTDTSSATATVNPLMNASLNATLTQPLARGFLASSADRQVDLSRIDVDIAASQFRQKATQVLQQVLGQYWELDYALAVYDARRQSKDLALVQYESAKLRVQNGFLPPVALTAARAEIASRERDLLQAEVQIITADNTLKFLISQDPSAAIWQAAVIATDAPAPLEGDIDLQGAVDMASARRPEIEQLRLQAAQNAVDRRFYWREKLPTVNLTASFTSAGRSGSVLVKQGDGRVADPTNPTYGGFTRSWGHVFGFEFPGWSLGVNVQMPLRNRTAAAQLEQANLARTRLDTQATRALQAVMVDVRNVVQVIATQRKSLEAAKLTTQLFAEQLDAQMARYEANFSNDFELRRNQRDLVDARVRELRALVDLQLATIALQRATDTLLDDYGVPATLVPRPGLAKTR